MSNQHAATLGRAPMTQSARSAGTARPSFLHRVFQSWLLAYGNRVDADGNIMCEH
ncbi:hypothetical protein HH212_21805 [Massilia forsythiae]|uniref:Uncharacterized protein n=1 Tax=Massilia forsythiae TaxID=2728020 RepID=A0A7Z2W0P4_9BURK|nr:hypothetical protein [Massilia forsythiae]QJE02332.1 hypothetical protein HH212_21805 [Massilia forsythiae]